MIDAISRAPVTKSLVQISEHLNRLAETTPRLSDFQKDDLTQTVTISLVELRNKQSRMEKISDIHADSVVLDLTEVRRLREMTDEAKRTTEEMLAQIAEQMSVTLESLPIVAYQCSADGEFSVTYVNRIVEPTTGFMPEEVKSTSGWWKERIHPDDRDGVLTLVDRELTPGKLVKFHYRWKVKDGSYGWFHDRMQLVEGKDGSPSYIIGTRQDITENKASHEKLRAAHDELNSRNNVLQLLATGRPIDEILTTICHEMEKVIPHMRCSILLLDRVNQRFTDPIAPNLPEFYNNAIAGLKIGPEVGSCGRAASTGECVITPDIEVDPNWKPFLRVAREANIRACWSQPIRSTSKNVLGSFAVYFSEVRDATEADKEFIEKSAHLAAVAIERAQTINKLQNAVEAAHELLQETDITNLYRRSVELARVGLGLERCAIFVRDKDSVLGTFGTTLKGEIVDESSIRHPFEGLWRRRIERVQQSKKNQWIESEETYTELGRNGVKAGREGTIAITALPSPDPSQLPIGVLVNDNALSGSPLDRATQGIVSIYCSIVGSIAYRLQTQQLLEQLAQHCRTVLYMYDGNGKDVTYVSPAYERIFHDQCKNVLADSQRWLEALHTEDRERISVAWYNQWHIHAATGTFDEEYRIVARDKATGENVEKWIWDRAVPIVDEKGRVIRIVGTAEDITDRKKAEFARLENQRLLEAILDHSPALISTKDTSGRYTTANRRYGEFVVGFQFHDSIIGRTVFEVFPELIAKRIRANDEEVLRNREPKEFEIELPGPRGIHTYVSHKFPLFDDSGRIYAVGAISTDVTDRRETWERATAAEAEVQAIDRFVAKMSHDLRTPFNVIQMNASRLVSDPGLSENHREALSMIAESSSRLLSLMDDTLILALRRAGQLTAEKICFDLRKLLELVQYDFWAMAERKGLEFAFDCSTNVPQVVKTDPNKLYRILINVIGNAVRFTDNGKVSMCVEQDFTEKGRRIVIAVADTGPGVPDAEKEEIFKDFSRGSSHAGTKSGAGLGLSIAREFARVLGGDLWVGDNKLRGAIFTFDIPVELPGDDDVISELMSRRVVRVRDRHVTYRILVAEDDDNMRKTLCRVLEDVGFDVRPAENGKVALRLWEESRPHLILMDLVMPEVDGYEAAAAIRGCTGAATIPIIAVSGSEKDKFERSKKLPDGFAAFLPKPVSTTDLYDTIAAQLNLEYEYEDTAESTPSKVPRSEPVLSEFRKLDPGVVTRLQAGALQADSNALKSIVDEIDKHQPQVANAIREQMENYSYDAIVRWCEETLQL